MTSNTRTPMYNQEKIKPYSNEGEKKQQVEQMFDNIAATYDTLNHRLSWNIDRYWRRRLIASFNEGVKKVLDVATGTGDLAIALLQKTQSELVVGIDLSDGMLAIAREKAKRLHLEARVIFQKDDCLQLSFPDNSFDAVTAAFGIRNFQELDMGLREMHRVLKPNGQLRIIELTCPVHFPMRQLFWLYSHTLLPIYGRLLSRDQSAYRYLTATIEAFPQGEQMMKILQQAGFRDTSFKRLTFGICTLYIAEK